MVSLLDEARRYLPDGLSERGLATLYAQLARLDQRFPFYTTTDFEFLLQGDLIQDVNHYAFLPDGTVRSGRARVMLLSNTCDMSLENARDDEVMVSVAPIMRVSRWIEALKNRGVDAGKIEDKAKSARLQRLTSIVYLPERTGMEESFVLLDKIQSIPISLISNWKEARTAVLSQAGEWTLVTKLSMHFSRQLEGVMRG
ncbi:hypothetical protein [Stenotrophomonas maltophilia]|uniref:Uncharacterized protein n=1 Tax=Stenotrophomonas maltophilia TaxID=40324 RepID=A0AAJ2WJH8_STEMA|nr:hypothetical protein [Stenotrophomonas maltophilia]MDZ5764115.1 hypothetical protein [Stenotrophomonas maltophilia]